MIYLISATPGSGKTLWAMREIFNRVNEPEPWNIFTNIDGIKLDTAQPLKQKFEDYPPRSLVVIDEAQKIPHFSKKYKHPVKNENHPEVEFLQTHRHAEFLDIIYITQAPRLLNADVLDMVGMHYHLHRPMGMKMATWWLWKYHQLNPNTKSVKADAEDTGTFTYPKQLFGMYKSSEGGGDTHSKIRIPMKIVNAIWMLILVLGVTGWLWVKQKPVETVGIKESDKSVQKQDSSIKDQIPSDLDANHVKDLKNIDLDVECRKGVNVEKPECVQWFNDLTKTQSSVPFLSSDSDRIQSVKYDASKPFDDKEIKDNLTYEVKQKPVFSGCMKKGSKYIAYTQQGTILHDVSRSDCSRLIDDADRPFDYFKENTPIQAAQKTQSSYTVDNYQERREVINKRDNPHLYLEPDQKLVTSSYKNTIKD